MAGFHFCNAHLFLNKARSVCSLSFCHDLCIPGTKKPSTTSKQNMGRTCLCRVLPCLRYMGPRYHSNWGSPGRIEAQCTTASLASPEDPGANGRLEPELSKTFLQIAKCENVKRDYFALFEELTIPLST